MVEESRRDSASRAPRIARFHYENRRVRTSSLREYCDRTLRYRGIDEVVTIVSGAARRDEQVAGANAS